MKMEIRQAKTLSVSSLPGRNRRRRKESHIFRQFAARMVKHYQNIWENLTAAVFTATLFLGVSYLFFVKLAEHGWY